MADKVNGLLDPTEQDMLTGLLGRMKPEELLRALQNSAQSVSNLAADNVVVPVDGIAYLLKQAGLPIEKPVGGSDWMREKGLTAPTYEGPSKLIGDSIGYLTPLPFTKMGRETIKDLIQNMDKRR